jgi:pimeloyl-ACP methyl ester carboxylesterase
MATTETIAVNGLVVGYDVHGSGPPLVMLHGATSVGRDDFAAQIPLFSKAFRLYLPDARHHGTTRGGSDRPFTYAELVDDLAALVDALGLRTFHLLGFSMGAMTALQYAARSPERLRTLVVAGITTQREPRTSVVRRLMDPGRIEREDPAWARELSRRHDAVQGRGGWQRVMPMIAADIARQPLLGPRELRGIDCPTLVAVGDRDPFVPVDHAWGLTRQLPDARLFVAPSCGHEVMVRRPALFNEAVAAFYRQTEPVARRRAEAVGPIRTAPPARGIVTSSARASWSVDPPEPGGTDAGWLDGHPGSEGPSTERSGDASRRGEVP